MNAVEESRLIEVCVIEDHSDYRMILCDALNDAARLMCHLSFSCVEDALDELPGAPVAPDVILLDLGLPGMDGIEGIPALQACCPAAKILVLTIYDNKVKVFQALGAGAFGYLIKSSDMDAILQGVENAYNGNAPLSAEIASMVFTTFANYKATSPEGALTERETEILKALADGCSRKMAAEQLGISGHTVDTHIRRIYKKLQVHNLTGAIAKALDRGLL